MPTRSIPITDAPVLRPALPADIVKLLTVFPVMVETGVRLELSKATPRTFEFTLVALFVNGPAELPIVLLATVAVRTSSVCTRMPYKSTAPVDVLVAVIEPSELLEMVVADAEEFKIPCTSLLLIEEELNEMPVAPVKLPIVLPVTLPISTRPLATSIPVKGADSIVPSTGPLTEMAVMVLP